MAVGYEDFLRESKELLAGASDEIRYRSSMSKAYYSLYHVALMHADAIHVPAISSMSGPSHKNLSSFYSDGLYTDKLLQNKLKKVGYSLKALHDGRCKADYRLSETVSALDAGLHLKRCEQNIALVEELMRAKAA